MNRPLRCLTSATPICPDLCIFGGGWAHSFPDGPGYVYVPMAESPILGMGSFHIANFDDLVNQQDLVIQ